MSKRDATPSWSGFIFQGEVAICVALEKINEIGIDNLETRNALLVESDEDFSIRENVIEVYQVKAKANSRMSAYKKTVEQLIDRYTYSIAEIKNPSNKSKPFRTYSIAQRNRPIKSYLVSWYEITDWDKDNFHNRYSPHIDTTFSLVSGVYTVENIEDKTKIEIRKLLDQFGIDYNDYDLNFKYSFLCSKIESLIKESHSKGVKKEITFEKIVEHVRNTPAAYNSDIGWYHVKRNFYHALMEELDTFKGHTANAMLEKKEKIERVVKELDKLNDNQFRGLLENNLIPHKDLKGGFTLAKYGDYLDKNLVKGILCEAITSIKNDPNYSSLAFTCSNTHKIYQTTLLNNSIPNDDRYSSQLMELVEKLNDTPISNDVSFFINQNLNLDLDDAEKVLNNILSVTPDDTDVPEGFNVFGLREIDKAANELN